MKAYDTRKGRSAFTLIEIMVATVVMVVLVGLVIQITSEVLNVWNRSSGKLAANAQARVAMEVLTQDLETAVFRNNGMLWLEAENSEEIPSVAGYQAQTVKLILFTPALDRPKRDNSDVEIPGDICAVQYKLVYQDPVDGSNDMRDNTFALHRRLIDSSTTFNWIMEPSRHRSGDWADGPVTPAAGVNMDYPLAEDPDYYLVGSVANFRVDFYVVDENGDSVQVKSPVRFGGQTNAEPPDSTATVGPHSINSTTQFPLAYAEITLTVLSDEGNRQLQASGSRGTTDGKALVSEHGEVFTRRVNFLARPL